VPSNTPNSDPKEILDKFDTFLFDYDGTVSNTWPQWAKFLVYQFKLMYGLEVTEKQVTNLAGVWDSAVQLGVPPEKFDPIAWRKACDEESVNYIKKADLFNGMSDLLKLLKKQSKKIGVVTGGSRIYIDSCLEHHELKNFFDVVVSADDVTAHKPDPEPIFHALEMIDQDVESAIMLGDTINDIMAANSAKVASLFFDPPDHEHHDSSKIIGETKPTYVISSWTELLK